MDTVHASIAVTDLSISTMSGFSIVEQVALSLQQGEIVGLVGESGAGKSSVGLALLGYAQDGAAISSGNLELGATDIDIRDQHAMRKKRGTEIAYVPQEPGVSLNPSVRVGDALKRMRRAHGLDDRDETIERLLSTVSLPSLHEFQRRYPHQLSGGQQQRLCLAIGIACEPRVLVLDEITTGLDVITQAAILAEVVVLARAKNVGVVYITHDLAVVSNIADRIIVMYAGEIVESGPSQSILKAPNHPYTKALIEAAPNHSRPSIVKPLNGIAPSLGIRPNACQFADRCELATALCREERPKLVGVGSWGQVRCIHSDQVAPVRPAQPRDTGTIPSSAPALLRVTDLTASHKTRLGRLTVARGISFTVHEGECVALVGESGSGKTTIARSIAGLHPADSGEIEVLGVEVETRVRKRSLEERRQLQFIFQNPRASLNPKQTVETILSRPLRALRHLSGKTLEEEMQSLIEVVRLPKGTIQKYPRELSGGERQRIGIARALAADPKVLICDEVTSALDVSVQAAVLELLRELSVERGLGMLMITHDLGVVASIAHQVLVLRQGDICEEGEVERILYQPEHPYTQSLLSAAPLLHASE